MDAASGDLALKVTSPDELTEAESRERYASMFTYHPHAAYSVDRTGHYTDGNPRALEMTGLTLEQMRHSHFSQVIHPEDTHLIQASFDRALGGSPQLTEARVLRPDGGVVDIRCTMIPVIVDGEVVGIHGIHGITEDVTEAKQMLRRLEAANAAKTLFLANVSHEVRTPLATVIGATELAMDHDLEPEPRHFVGMAHRAGERLMRLVTEVLDYSRLEEHQVALRRRPFSVRAVVEEVADWAVPLAEARDLTISFTVDDAIPERAVGDGLRTGQVLTNLVQNAIKFTCSGGVDVRVSPCVSASTSQDGVSAAGPGVEFTITDTGIGISEEHLQDLFEPFTQADPSVTREYEGIGLGLSICRDLVELMGGRLRVSSSLGKGSTFAFEVPLDPAEE